MKKAIAFAGLVLALLLSVSVDGTLAQPLARDGQIHACYRVKGKPKGAVRIVRNARVHCHRGERRVSWSATGSTGFGSTGSAGPAGAQGQAGAPADEATLKAEIGVLSQRVQTLEGLLQGITREQLLGAIDAVPAVQSLCIQGETLTKQVNELGSGVEGLIGVLKGTLLGSIFGGVEIPAALESFSCLTS